MKNEMTNEKKFLIFVIEYYKKTKGLTGKEVMKIFGEKNIWSLASKSYFLWHIESPNNFVKEIDRAVSAYDRP